MIAPLEITQNDVNNDLTFTLEQSDGTPFDLTGASALFKCQKANAEDIKFTGSMNITDAPNGKLKYHFVAGNFDEPGDYYAEIEITITVTSQVTTFGGIIIKVAPELPIIN
jgi:hypothetical protein